jgi:hypothetical protein
MSRFLLFALAACNEYGLDGKPDMPVIPAIPDDTVTDEPPTDGTPWDSGSPGDACFEPAYGYDTVPSVRLFSTDPAPPVTVTMVLSDTAYDDSFLLDAPTVRALGDAWATPAGTSYDLGTFPVDSELTFGLQVHDTGDHWQSGPASRNADGVTHVAVTYEGGCSWLIGFEDLWGGGDLDYNDVVIRVEGMLRQEF